jgi:VWFA-related protein
VSAQQPAGSQQNAPPQANAAQEPEAPAFRTGVTEVVVPVTVLDKNDSFVTDLTAADFEIYDQGVRQQIKFFSAERAQPVVIGFLMDLSNGMKTRWKEYRESAIDMVLALLTGDKKYQGYLVGYSTVAEVMVNTTYDSDKIVSKLNKVTPGGGAALYDAIFQACTNRKLVPGEPLEPHRVAIIVGDGHDNASSHTLQEVIELAQRSQMTVYAISTDAYGFTSDYGKNLRRLAEETGGRVEYPLQNTYDNTQGFLSRPANDGNREFADGTGGYQAKILGSIFNSVRKIAGEVTTQYILRYQPNTPGDESLEHRIQVRVPTLPNVTVRARPQYFVTNP